MKVAPDDQNAPRHSEPLATFPPSRQARPLSVFLLKFSIAGCLMLWVVFLALQMELRQSIPDFDLLSWRDKWVHIWNSGVPGILGKFRSVHPFAFVMSLMCVGMTIVAGVFRWRAFLRSAGCDSPLPQLISVTMSGYFFNSFLLGSTGGDVVKAYYAARSHPGKTELAVTSVILDRLFGLLFMMGFAALAIVPLASWMSHHPALSQLRWKIATLAVSAGIAIAGISALFTWMNKGPIRLPERFGRHLDFVQKTIRALWQDRTLLGNATVWSLVINAFCVLQIQCLALGMHIPVDALYLAFAVPVIITISAIPLTPSGFGIRENLYVYLLGFANPSVSPSDALALSLLAYAGSFLWNLAGGIFFLLLRNPEAHENSKSSGSFSA